MPKIDKTQPVTDPETLEALIKGTDTLIIGTSEEIKQERQERCWYAINATMETFEALQEIKSDATRIAGGQIIAGNAKDTRVALSVVDSWLHIENIETRLTVLEKFAHYADWPNAPPQAKKAAVVMSNSFNDVLTAKIHAYTKEQLIDKIMWKASPAGRRKAVHYYNRQAFSSYREHQQKLKQGAKYIPDTHKHYLGRMAASVYTPGKPAIEALKLIAQFPDKTCALDALHMAYVHSKDRPNSGLPELTFKLMESIDLPKEQARQYMHSIEFNGAGARAVKAITKISDKKIRYQTLLQVLREFGHFSYAPEAAFNYMKRFPNQELRYKGLVEIALYCDCKWTEAALKAIDKIPNRAKRLSMFQEIHKNSDNWTKEEVAKYLPKKRPKAG